LEGEITVYEVRSDWIRGFPLLKCASRILLQSRIKPIVVVAMNVRMVTRNAGRQGRSVQVLDEIKLSTYLDNGCPLTAASEASALPSRA
jgi:hypothetical protein